jgi:hypothetical protein
VTDVVLGADVAVDPIADALGNRLVEVATRHHLAKLLPLSKEGDERRLDRLPMPVDERFPDCQSSLQRASSSGSVSRNVTAKASASSGVISIEIPAGHDAMMWHCLMDEHGRDVPVSRCAMCWSVKEECDDRPLTGH